MSQSQKSENPITKISLGMEVFYEGHKLDQSALASHVSTNANQWLTSIESRNPGDAALHSYQAQSVANPEQHREALEAYWRQTLEQEQPDIHELGRLITTAGLTSVPEFINQHLGRGTSDQVFENNQDTRKSPPDK